MTNIKVCPAVIRFLVQICGQVYRRPAAPASLAYHLPIKMQLFHTFGLLAIVIISLISISSLQANVWSNCRAWNHRGSCITLRPPSAPKMNKESELGSNSTEEFENQT